jgi:hypothetical protein
VPPPISDSFRGLVAERAGARCEYCRLHQEDSFHPHQIDHVISRKHGGTSDESNLAYSCLRCNAWKGSDIASLDPLTGELAALFHPRIQQWQDHFRLDRAILEPLTPAGRATARLLRLNLDQRVIERRTLMRTRPFSEK